MFQRGPGEGYNAAKDEPPALAIFMLVACLLPLSYALAYAALWVVSAILSVVWPVLAVVALAVLAYAAFIVIGVAIAD